MLELRPRCGRAKLISAWSTIVLAALLAAPAAYADNGGGTTQYSYDVTLLDYHGSADLAGAKLPGDDCQAYVDSSWTGGVNTSVSAGGELAPLVIGEADLEIHKHGTRGHLSATQDVTSYFTDAYSYQVTACSTPPPEPTVPTEDSTLPCGSTEGTENHQIVTADISGGVGTRLTVSWQFSLSGQTYRGAELVPDSFVCLEPFRFPHSDDSGVTSCTTKATIKQFNRKHVTLPFTCQFGPISATPGYYGYGQDYTYYRAFAQADGLIQLKRK